MSCVESCPSLKIGHMKNGHVYKIQVTSDLFILSMFDNIFLVTFVGKCATKGSVNQEV